MIFTVYTSAFSPIDLEVDPLAAPGGEGSVHLIKSTGNFSNCCVKIYHQPKRTSSKQKKIEFMVKNKPQILSTPNYKICWPIALVFDKNKIFIGFIMPLAFIGSEKLYELTTTKISQRLISKWSKFERTSKLGIEKRLKVCVNIAIAIHSIHQTNKYTIIDFKPQNILITNEGKISITDVDSFQIAENKIVLYSSEVTTPEYAPPESFKLNLSKSFISESWDRFSLAISFYEILFGIHPYVSTCGGQYENVTTIGEKIHKGLFVHGSKRPYLTVIPPIHDNFNNLPISIKNLFIDAFENGHTNPTKRPSAELWGQTINGELFNNSGIKANVIALKKKSPSISTTNSLNNTLQLTNTTNTSHIQKTAYPTVKKDNYMIWKILTIILAIVAAIFYFRGVSNDGELSSLKNRVSTEEANNINLQNQIAGLQSNQTNSQTNYNTRITELENIVDSIGSKYPILLNDITFNNVNHESAILTSETHDFAKSETQYIQPVIKFNSNLRSSANERISYKIFDPSGTLFSTANSPSGYTWFKDIAISGNLSKNNSETVNGYSVNCPNSCIIGRYKVEIWCNGTMLGESYFNINE